MEKIYSAGLEWIKLLKTLKQIRVFGSLNRDMIQGLSIRHSNNTEQNFMYLVGLQPSQTIDNPPYSTHPFVSLCNLSRSHTPTNSRHTDK